MNESESRPEVKIGDVVEVGFAWGGAVGKVVGQFAVELLERQGDRFLSRVVEFRGCWYYWHDENVQRFESPFMTTREELPAPLAAEISLLIGSVIGVHVDIAQSGVTQYIYRPGEEPKEQGPNLTYSFSFPPYIPPLGEQPN